jgi:dTDP-4-dehydrorhamnose reductase
MKNILIVGKKSFLANSIFNFLKKKKLKISLKSFEEVLSKNITDYTHIINGSINKSYCLNKYKKINDLDLRIAKKIINSKTKYIFFSSRKVYKNKFNTLESDHLNPCCNYSRNKLITESQLLKTLESRIIILRISNILGLKKKFKNNRNIHSLFLDNFFNYQLTNKKILHKDSFKDFITINQFNKVIYLIIKSNIKGIFNLSLGKKIYLSEIILWLKKLNRRVFIKKKLDLKSSFTLNNKKLLSKISVKLLKKDVKKYCLNLHKQHKNYLYE